MNYLNNSYRILKGVSVVGFGFLAILLINTPVMAENHLSSPVSTGIPDQSTVQKYPLLKTESANTTMGDAGNDSVVIKTTEQENEIVPITGSPNDTGNDSLVMRMLAHKWDGYIPNKSAERKDSSDNSLIKNSVSTLGSTGTDPYPFVTQWGTTGSGNGQFYAIQGIAIDTSDYVYVTDYRTSQTFNSRVQKFKSDGTYLTQWGTNGSDTGEFFAANGIAADTMGNVYVVDTGNYRVQKFKSDGTNPAQWGTYGTGNGQFNVAWNIATDLPSNVYVTDVGNERVQKFSSDGAYLTKWGTSGTGNGQFNYLNGIATDSSGNVYVADAWNHRIQKFSSTGSYITQWGTKGSGNGQFDHPYGIAVDKSGNVFVTDSFNDRVQMFSSDGSYITQWGTYGTGNGQFVHPDTIAVNPSGYVYVGDGNDRIQVFKPAEEVVEKTYSITNAWVHPQENPPFTSWPDSERYILNITKELNDGSGWVQAFPEINGTNIKKAQFGVNPTSSDHTLNEATIHWHIGHGGVDSAGHTAITIPTKYNESSKDFDYDFIHPSDVTTKWGGNNKWVVLQDCYILNDNDWGTVLGTTHGIFGFTTPTDTKSALPSIFLKHAKSGETLLDAWNKATHEVYYMDIVPTEIIIGPDGKPKWDNYNNTVFVHAGAIYKTSKQRDQDHLPGFGSVAPNGDPNAQPEAFPIPWNCSESREGMN